MGIVSLWEFVKKQGVGCTKIEWKDFKGKRIAIEANTLAFKFKYGNQPDSLFQQFALLIADCWEVGVESIIVVMDGGEYPELKLSTKLKRQKENQKARERTQKVEELLFSSTNPTEELDDQTLEDISPNFFNNLKRKIDSIPLPIETVVSSTQPDQQNLIQEVPSSTQVPEPTQTSLEDEETKEKKRKTIKEDQEKAKKEWIEAEKKRWTKGDFLKTVYESRQKISPVTSDDYAQLGIMLASMGVITINADGESESFCASLSQMGVIDWVISEDSDLFGFGARKIVRDVSWASKRKEGFRLFDVDVINDHLGLKPKDWISICVLCQNDYNKDGCRIAGIGMANAFKEVKTGKPYNEIIIAKHKAQEDAKKKPKKAKKTKKDKTELEIEEVVKDQEVIESEKQVWSLEEILEKSQKIYDYFHSFWIADTFGEKERQGVEEWILSFRKKADLEVFNQFWNSRTKSASFVQAVIKAWKTMDPSSDPWSDPNSVLSKGFVAQEPEHIE
jgi:5'-3' exonuclease